LITLQIKLDQAARVLDLAGTSVEDLAALSEQELGMTADSAMNKFRKSVEDLKMAFGSSWSNIFRSSYTNCRICRRYT
jgi:hypothetical protein